MRRFLQCIILIMAMVSILPVILVFVGTFMGNAELESVLGPVINGTDGYAVWHFIPLYPTLMHIVELLFDTPEYFVLFWNSVKIAASILVGQFIVAVPAAWWLARSHTKFGKIIMLLYMFCMLLPFQVTMLSQYIVLNQFSMVNTHSALIWPLIFSTFPIFITYNSFEKIPQSVIDAAGMDGAGCFRVYWHIALPMAKNGILASGILGFFEYWNMVEQPSIFIKDKELWPLSLYLPEVINGEAGRAFAFSALSILPAFMILWAGKNILNGTTIEMKDAG